MQAQLHVATRAARLAAKVLLRYWERRDTLTITEKQPNDWVSEADRQSEQTIIEHLQQAYPDHGFLGEELGQQGKDSDYQWIIDPLDGTRNYLRGIPHFAISIALCYQQQIQCAVIYDPIRDELFTAIRGSGAQADGHRIRIKQTPSHLSQAIIATGRLPSKETVPHYPASLQTIMQQVDDVRRTGSAALDLAYVASGRFDGFFEYQLQPWDIAAGALLVTEAGGFIEDIQGKADFLTTGHVLATHPKLIQNLRQLILTPPK